jgi:hypothetical protein
MGLGAGGDGTGTGTGTGTGAGFVLTIITCPKSAIINKTSNTIIIIFITSIIYFIYTNIKHKI